MSSVNENWLVLAVRKLKAEGRIVRDKEVADETGYSKESISNMLSGRSAVSEKFKRKFEEVYGKRNIVSEDRAPYGSASQLDLGDRTIINVPLVGQLAYAGYLSGFADNEFVETLPTTAFVVDKEPKGKYIAFEVRGDSMDDGTSESYISGDIILCREIKRELWQSKLHIKKWDFVIVHRTKGIVIKKIKSHDTATGFLTLHSINTEYEDFTVKIDDVLQLFNVVQVMRKK